MSCPFFKGNLPAGAANPHEGGERRLATVAAHLAPALAPSPVAAPGSQPASYLAELKACKTELLALLDEINCNPILVRLAWHDAGTFDASLAAWPACGGANGSIRFQAELEHGANAGLAKGINVYLMPIHKRHPAVSWADLIQLGSACAVAHAGGPAIPMRYGRVDVPDAACCPPSGRLPDAAPPYGGGAPDAATHLRAVFHRMGFNDAEIVALSGAHTLGRAFKERSGQSEFGVGKPTQYTRGDALARADGKPGVGLAGGQSWTPQWLKFDNSYFTVPSESALLKLATDAVLWSDPGFRPHALRYGASQAAFFSDYAAAHAKLSELGSAFRWGGLLLE